jgi:hypothetical protein
MEFCMAPPSVSESGGRKSDTAHREKQFSGHRENKDKHPSGEPMETGVEKAASAGSGRAPSTGFFTKQRMLRRVEPARGDYGVRDGLLFSRKCA